MDMSGGIFCTLSLIFKEEFDIVAGVSSFPHLYLVWNRPADRPYPSSFFSRHQVNYIGIIVLDGLILILACILNPRANRRRKREALESSSADAPESLDEAERGRDVGAVSGVERVEGEGLTIIANQERRETEEKKIRREEHDGLDHC
jgi:hypothetical protein